MKWLSPLSGMRLEPDTPHSLTGNGSERWPVIEGIPFLRTGRDDLIANLLRLLDDGCARDALVLALSDQDPWWTGPPTAERELHELVERRAELSLREAMALLRFGPVADYFAHRWSDPTFLAGLALIEAHRGDARTAFELAAGIGHYARELERVGVTCLCADIVFAKCWLAKNWIVSDAKYVVFDAKDRWPLGKAQFDLVHCQDAFYFFAEQEKVATRLRAAVAPGGVLAIGHLHNSAVTGGAFGPARTGDEWRELFSEAIAFDERELRAALLEARVPEPCDWQGDRALEAWSIVEGEGSPSVLAEGIAAPASTSRLRPNPLISENGPVWPSKRYAAEYGPSATFTDPQSRTPPERDRRLVDLPERW